MALNCVANGKLLRDKSFDQIWIQPAAGDAGGALGAALGAYHLFKGQSRRCSRRRDAHARRLSRAGLRAVRRREATDRAWVPVFDVVSDAEKIDCCAQALADGKAVGWHQGRMEFGPRALGGRSILGDARSPTMQKLLNLKVKYRESFRPFAPSVLREDVADWFDLDEDSPYMLLVADVRAGTPHRDDRGADALFGIDKLNVPRSTIPAVTHVDYSARIQTVHADTNPRYHALITRFKDLTGCPVVVNTSFNVRGEPIVCTPEDSFHCFMGTDIEVLAVGNCILEKHEQDASLKTRYETKFDLD